MLDSLVSWHLLFPRPNQVILSELGLPRSSAKWGPPPTLFERSLYIRELSHAVDTVDPWRHLSGFSPCAFAARSRQGTGPPSFPERTARRRPTDHSIGTAFATLHVKAG